MQILPSGGSGGSGATTPLTVTDESLTIPDSRTGCCWK